MTIYQYVKHCTDLSACIPLSKNVTLQIRTNLRPTIQSFTTYPNGYINCMHSSILRPLLQKTAVIEIELPGTSSKKGSKFNLSRVTSASSGDNRDSGKEQKLHHLKAEVKQVNFRKESKQSNVRRESQRPPGEKHEGRGRRKTIKEVKLEDEIMQENRQDDDDFCAKRLTKLKKRGENDDSLIILDNVPTKGEYL